MIEESIIIGYMISRDVSAASITWIGDVSVRPRMVDTAPGTYQKRPPANRHMTNMAHELVMAINDQASNRDKRGYLKTNL